MSVILSSESGLGFSKALTFVTTGSTLRLCCVAQDKTTKKLYFFINQVSRNGTRLWYKYHSTLPNELKQEIQRIKEVLLNKDSLEIFDF